MSYYIIFIFISDKTIARNGAKQLTTKEKLYFKSSDLNVSKNRTQSINQQMPDSLDIKQITQSAIAWKSTDLTLDKKSNFICNDNSSTNNTYRVDQIQYSMDYHGSSSNSATLSNVYNNFSTETRNRFILDNELTFTGKFSPSSQSKSCYTNEKMSSTFSNTMLDTVVIESSSNSSNSSNLWNNSSLDDTNVKMYSNSNHISLPLSDDSNFNLNSSLFISNCTNDKHLNKSGTKSIVRHNTISSKKRKFTNDPDSTNNESKLNTYVENTSYLDNKQKKALVRSTTSKKVKTTKEILAVIQNKYHVNPNTPENNNCSESKYKLSSYQIILHIRSIFIYFLIYICL